MAQTHVVDHLLPAQIDLNSSKLSKKDTELAREKQEEGLLCVILMSAIFSGPHPYYGRATRSLAAYLFSNNVSMLVVKINRPVKLLSTLPEYDKYIKEETAKRLKNRDD